MRRAQCCGRVGPAGGIRRNIPASQVIWAGSLEEETQHKPGSVAQKAAAEVGGGRYQGVQRDLVGVHLDWLFQGAQVEATP